jgi:hypothetical protein
LLGVCHRLAYGVAGLRSKPFVIQKVAPMRFLALAAIVACAVATSACGQSKVTQCNAMIEEANKGQTAFEKVDFDKPALVKASLEKVKASNTSLEAVKLEDEKLKTLRTQYVKTHTDAADVMGRLAGLAEKIEKADEATSTKLEAESVKVQKELEVVEKASSKVIDDLNTYCTGSK